MIITICLVNIRHHNYTCFIFVMRISRFSLNNFQIRNPLLLTIVTMLYITYVWLIYLITGTLYLLTSFMNFIHLHPASGNHQSALCIYEFFIFSNIPHIVVVVVQPLSLSNSLQPHELQQVRFPCPSQSPGVCSNSCKLSQWCHPTISSSVITFFSCPQSFPTSGTFPMSWLCASGGQSVGASVLQHQYFQ